MDEADDLGVPVENILQDSFRIQYHHDYLTYVIGAMRFVLKCTISFNIAKMKCEMGGTDTRDSNLSLFQKQWLIAFN